MEIVESGVREAENCEFSVPRGGPIFIPNLLGPETTVSKFEVPLLIELQELKEEIQDSSELCDEDISVDELKLYKEEDLVNLAMNETFKDGENNENCPPLDSSHAETTNNQKLKKRKVNLPLDNSCLDKVKELVERKKKQDEDRVSVKLHSFNCDINDSAPKSSERYAQMTSLKSTGSTAKDKSWSLAEPIAVQYPEVVLSVEVYHNVRKWVKTQEFLVLGCQTLTALREKIYCSTDMVMQKAGQNDRSGYFFIEGQFCNDMRDPTAIDYSKPILDWLRNSKDEAKKKWEYIVTGDLLQKQKQNLGDLSVSEFPYLNAFDMHRTRFCDLRFRLGYGYLYCHQGDCCHTIVIRDIRLIHPDDVQNRAIYPMITFQLKFRVQKCSVCKIMRATRVTMDDKWAAENPCYFCDDCFSLLHEAEDGSLLYTEFTEYDYLHD